MTTPFIPQSPSQTGLNAVPASSEPASLINSTSRFSFAMLSNTPAEVSNRKSVVQSMGVAF